MKTTALPAWFHAIGIRLRGILMFWRHAPTAPEESLPAAARPAPGLDVEHLPEPVEPTKADAPEPQPGTPMLWRRARGLRSTATEEHALAGAFVELGDILVQLDRAHLMLRKLRKFNDDVLNVGARTGVRLIPHNALISTRPTALRPAFGIAYLADDPTRPERPEHGNDPVNMPLMVACAQIKTSVFSLRGRVYVVRVIHYSIKHDRLYGYEFHAIVGDTGALAVPSPCVRRQRLPNGDAVHHSGMHLPPALVEHFDDTDGRIGAREKLGQTAAAFGGGILAMALNIIASGVGRADLTVLSEQKNQALRFYVDPLPGVTSRFFRDRAFEAASDGKRKRIIHYVEPHDRVLADGRIVAVRGHYRGAVEFTWGRSRVRVITPPALGVEVRTNDPLEGEEIEGARVPRGMIGGDAAGRRIRGAMAVAGRER